jgi:adenosylmethionine-8-amino-7-oxononanoate aminotransferase
VIKSASPVWHPFTQHGLEPPALKIARSEGACLIAEDGRKIIDAISSWWVITHGHRHPKIVAAIQEAAGKLDQIIFAGFTHEYAEQLGAKLLAIAPAGLSHVFFSDSGSICVEVAIKMALGYFRNSGRSRSRIVVLEHGYHGDTVGGMSVSARGVFNAPYEPLLFSVETIPFPEQGHEQKTLDAFEELCRAGEIAALVIEPLICGAGGMKIYAPFVLSELRRISQSYGVLLIADEVMTGWGRTGTLFACEQAGISPDILCLSKGLTGGALPLAVTLCRSEIYEAHLSHDRARSFFHSSSYTANPLVCAAALANIEIWENEPVLERINKLQITQKSFLEPFSEDSRFQNVRQLGTITALDLHVSDAGYLSQIGLRLRQFFLERDILLRPLGNVIYVMPPYCINEEELGRVYAAITEAGAQFQ